MECVGGKITPRVGRKIFLSEKLNPSDQRNARGSYTKVIGLTIQEIFITGMNPTFTVALICSRFLAPAGNFISQKHQIQKGLAGTNNSH